jgi:hypothetical protein
MNYTTETQRTLRKTYEEVFSLRFLSLLTLCPRPTKLSSLNETITNRVRSLLCGE